MYIAPDIAMTVKTELPAIAKETWIGSHQLLRTGIIG
jgi:hypothetical protein